MSLDIEKTLNDTKQQLIQAKAFQPTGGDSFLWYRTEIENWEPAGKDYSWQLVTIKLLPKNPNKEQIVFPQLIPGMYWATKNNSRSEYIVGEVVCCLDDPYTIKVLDLGDTQYTNIDIVQYIGLYIISDQEFEYTITTTTG